MSSTAGGQRGFAMSSPESSPPHYHEMSQLEAEQPVSNGELEVILPREGEGSERNQASAASSSNSDEISSEGDQNNPAIQLEQVSLEESEDLDREVEAINYHSTTADTEKRGPIAIVVTPAIGEIPDKKPLTSEIPDDLFIPKTDSLSLKAAYGATTAHSRVRSASPVPNVLGEEARKMASAKKVAVLVAVAAAIAVVWGVLLLPLVFYHLPEDTTGCAVYSGVCQEFLQRQQTCLGVLSSGVSVPQGRGDEAQALLFITALPQFLTLSPGCDAVIEQFLCFYIFGLCDSTGEVQLPSSGECRMVTEETCGPELEQAMMFIAGIPDIQLPQCDTLPDFSDSQSSECLIGNRTIPASNRSSEIEPMTAPTGSNSSELELRCSPGFFIGEVNGITACLPECGEWEEFPHEAVVAVDFFIIFFAVVYLVGAAAVITLSVIHHKRMFKFPSIFIVYGNITLGVYELSILIGCFDRKALFCSSRELEESVANPTGYCSLQGVIQYYCSLLQTLIWLCHVSAIFWTVRFPLSAKYFESKGYFLFVHIGMIVVALVIPVIPVAAAFATGGFTPTRFPPIICFAENVDVTFYGLNLPLCILLATGITLILLILYTLIGLIQEQVATQKKGSLKAFLQSRLHINPAELKILIVFVYSIIFAAVGVIAFLIGSRNTDTFRNQLTAYFGCEALGVQPGGECERAFDRTAVEVVVDLTLFFTAIYPIVSLIYVVNLQELKMFFTKHCMDTRMRSSTGAGVNSYSTHARSHSPMLNRKLSPRESP